MEIAIPADEAPPVFTIVGQIERWLRTQIASGALKPGDRLPSMTQLQAQFGAKSLSTIRTAQQRLAHDGLITTHQGLGVFVRDITSADPPAPGTTVVRDAPPRLLNVDPDTRTITIELRISAPPTDWHNAGFIARLGERWPTHGTTQVPGGRSGYTITIPDAELEDTVAEFDCLIAEANAHYLTVARPEYLRIKQIWQNAFDELTARPDGGLDINHLHARLDRLHPECPQDAERLARAVDAVTKAQVLRTMLESGRRGDN